MHCLLCFALLFASAAALSCPAEYRLMEGDRCIRPLFLWQPDNLTHLYPVAKDECDKDGAHLPIIRNYEENDAFNRIANSFDEINGWNIMLVLDLVCNSSTHRLEWVDSTTVDYTPYPGLDLSFDCTETIAVSMPKHDDWKIVSINDQWSYTVLCVTEASDQEFTTVKSTKPASVSPAFCPQQYQLMEGDRCIRPLILWQPDNLTNLNPLAKDECGKDGAHLPIIRNDEENNAFNRIANSFDEINGWNIMLVLDLVCNSSTYRLEWVDGPTVEYTPYPGLDLSFDCTETSAVSMPKHDDWKSVSVDETWSYTVLCVTEASDHELTTVNSTTLISVSPTVCPPQYQLMEGSRCIRPVFLWQPDLLSHLLSIADNECSKDGAHLPIIRNDEENEAFNRIANSFDEINGWNIRLVLDLVCNSSTHRLEWEDGTSVDYTPYPGLDLSFDCTTTTVVSEVKHDDWIVVSINDKWSYTALCVIDAMDIEITTVKAATVTPITSCPETYQLMEGGRCIRPVFLWQPDLLSHLRPIADSECSKDGAHLPIIRSDEDNEAFNRIANSFDDIKGWNIRLVLDLVCNSFTHRLEWEDGASVDYTPYPGLALSFDCTTTTVVSEVMHDDWTIVSINDKWSYTVLCVIELTEGVTANLK